MKKLDKKLYSEEITESPELINHEMQNKPSFNSSVLQDFSPRREDLGALPSVMSGDTDRMIEDKENNMVMNQIIADSKRSIKESDIKSSTVNFDDDGLNLTEKIELSDHLMISDSQRKVQKAYGGDGKS